MSEHQNAATKSMAGVQSSIATRDGSQRVWYLGKATSWTGPYTDQEILRCIHDKLATFADHIWSPSMPGMKWTRIASVEAFQQYLPALPPERLCEEIVASLPSMRAAAAAMAANGRGESFASRRRSSVWFLQFEGSEFGPLTPGEVQVILKSGKLKGRLFGWCEGMANWESVDQIPEFQESTATSNMIRTDSGDERRKSKRVPLVATVRFNIPGDTSAGVAQYMGVCRDISAEGLLILSNRVPVEGCEPIRMEVSPLGTSGVEPFLAEVDVLRVLPDQKGFSVKFRKLSAPARAAIEKYLARN